MPLRHPLRLSTLWPPLLTAAASAVILGGSVWIHDRRAASEVAGTTSAVSSPANRTSTSGAAQRGTSPTPGPGAAEGPGSPTKPPGDATGPSAGATPPPPPARDVGFSPVQGGRVIPASGPPAPGPGSAAVVLQYGVNPRTSFHQSTLTTAEGRVTVPAALPGRILAIALSRGVLWWPIPPTLMRPDGQRGPARSPAVLEYTPFRHPVASLTEDAVTLTTLPVYGSPGKAGPAQDGWTRWSPAATPHDAAGNGTASTDATPSGNSSPPGSGTASTNATPPGGGTASTNASPPGGDTAPTNATPPGGGTASTDATAPGNGTGGSGDRSEAPGPANATPPGGGTASTDATAPGNGTSGSGDRSEAPGPANPTLSQDGAKSNRAASGGGATGVTEASKAGVALTGETVDTAANAQPGGPPPDGSKSTSDAASAGSHPDGAASTGSYQLYPFGLYRVADGAVIAVSAIPQSGDVQEIWLYHWREGENHLTPIARLTNGDGQYSWYAVGWDVVYFETRHLVEPAMTNFSGRQAMFTLADDRLHAIALGHWVQQAQARGDDLWFQPGGQMNWYRFTPNGLPPAP